MAIHNVEIKSAVELHEWFEKACSGDYVDKVYTDGVMVTEEVRKEMMTCLFQGAVTIGNESHLLSFEDMRGGVWRAYISYPIC